MSAHSPYVEGTALDLKTTLRSLGVSVLDPKMVEEHMAKELAMAPKGNWLGRLLHRNGISARPFEIAVNSVAGTLMSGGLLCSIVSSFAMMGSGIAILLGSWNSWPIFAASIIFLFGGIVVYFGIGLLGAYAVKLAVYPAKWTTTDLATTPLSTPKEVLDRAFAARRFGIALEVEELRQEKILLDPVLFAYDFRTGERHAIAIWKDDVLIA